MRSKKSFQTSTDGWVTINECYHGSDFIFGKLSSGLSESPLDAKAFIGSFYGSYFFVANIAAFLLQTFVVSRIVKYFRIAGVVLFLQFIALGTYSAIAAGAGFAIIR